jgi:hypothetical protein
MTGKRTASFFVLLHAAVSITLAIIAGKPVERFDNLPFLIIMDANNYIALPVVPTNTQFHKLTRMASDLANKQGDCSWQTNKAN